MDATAMEATAEIVALIDRKGRVVAAELSGNVEAASTGDEPTGSLAPLEGHRVVSINVPREVLGLSGPDLHRYLSELQIDRDGNPRLPKVKIDRTHKGKK